MISRFRRWLAAGGLAATLLAAAPALAQDGPTPDLEAEARGVGRAVKAAEVAAWGRERRDPGALIMAARLLAEVPVRPGVGDPPILTPDRLLDEAEVLSEGNPPALDAIARLRETTRGVRNSPFGRGPVFIVKEIPARETYWFEVEARGGEILRVAAIGDGDTNIDMILRDASGALMCRDGHGDHYPVCTVTRPEGGKVRIDIVNRGAVWTKVQILTN